MPNGCLTTPNVGTATETQRDDAATAAEVADAHVAEIGANLAVARLPAHEGEIAAATLNVATVARDHAKWHLDKRKLAAPAARLVTDILRRPGEIATARQPILSLLPDAAVKLRPFSLRHLRPLMVREMIQMRRDRITFAMMIGVPLMRETERGTMENPLSIPSPRSKRRWARSCPSSPSARCRSLACFRWRR